MSDLNLKINTEIICPGVELRTLETDRFKSESLSAELILPLSETSASKAALLFSVLKHANRECPDLSSVTRRCDNQYSSGIGAINSKLGEIQIVGLGNSFLGDRWLPGDEKFRAKNIELLGKFLFDPYLVEGAFSPEYVAINKKNLIDAIREQINNKVSYAIRRGQEETCRSERYAVSTLGTEESIAAITPQELYDFYRECIVGARVVITRTGTAIDEGEMGEIRSLAAQFGSGDRGQLPKTDVIRTAGDKVREIIEEQPVKQGKLTLGFRTGKVLSDGDFYKFSLFNEVFGASPTSRLFMNVREKLSLCYYCTSIVEAQKGVMFVASGIENANKELAKEEILRQLSDLASGNITDAELDAARKSVINSYRAIYDSPEALKKWYTGRMLAGLDSSPAQASEQIMTVTKEDIARCAAGVTLDCDYFMKGTDLGEGDDYDEE